LNGDEATLITIKGDDKPLWSLVLGKKDNESGRYAKLPDSDKTFVVRGAFASLLRNAKDWRDKDIWHLSEPDAVFFSVHRPHQEITLQKDEQSKEWSLKESHSLLSATYRVDKNALASLVRANLNLRANDFIDEQKELKEPVLTLKVKDKDGKEKELLVYEGDKDYYWVKRPDSEQIFKISKGNFDRINMPVENLRDMTIMSIDKTAINRLNLRWGNKHIIAEKNDEQWRLSEPKQLPPKFEFDPNRVEDLINKVAQLRGVRVAQAKDRPENPEWKSSWLLELSAGAGKKMYLYATKNKSNKDEYLVQGNVDKETYIVPSYSMATLTRGLDSFKKEEMPAVDEKTLNSLPPDVRRRLMEMGRQKH
jgi:hypothetical protein